jgi:hypothetical protein
MDDDLNNALKNVGKQNKVSSFVILAGLAFTLYRIDGRVSELSDRVKKLEEEVAIIKMQNSRVNDKLNQIVMPPAEVKHL